MQKHARPSTPLRSTFEWIADSDPDASRKVPGKERRLRTSDECLCERRLLRGKRSNKKRVVAWLQESASKVGSDAELPDPGAEATWACCTLSSQGLDLE